MILTENESNNKYTIQPLRWTGVSFNLTLDQKTQYNNLVMVTNDFITRYGVVSEKASVLARASFETPIKHIINAALVGEEDKLSSVVENVMLNQPVPTGTGLPGLQTKVK